MEKSCLRSTLSPDLPPLRPDHVRKWAKEEQTARRLLPGPELLRQAADLTGVLYTPHRQLRASGRSQKWTSRKWRKYSGSTQVRIGHSRCPGCLSRSTRHTPTITVTKARSPSHDIAILDRKRLSSSHALAANAGSPPAGCRNLQQGDQPVYQPSAAAATVKRRSTKQTRNHGLTS